MHDKRSLVSIIMPSYNSQDTIGDSIKSVIQQSYTNWELIVTDDFSTDSSRCVVESFSAKDKRIKLFSLKKNSGAAKARNNSIRHSSGRYIAFLDADDLWLEGKLELQIASMNEYNFSVCYSSYIRFNDSGDQSNIKAKSFLTFDDMLSANYIGNLTGVYDASKLGKFYQNDIGHEDYDMWLRILKKSNALGISAPLAKYRVSSDSLSSNIFKGFIWHYSILKSNTDENTIKIFMRMLSYLLLSLKKRLPKIRKTPL